MIYRQENGYYQICDGTKIKFDVRLLQLPNFNAYTLKGLLIAQCIDDYMYVLPGYTWNGTSVIGKYYETDETLTASLIHDLLYQLYCVTELKLSRRKIDLLYSQYLSGPKDLIYYLGVRMAGWMYTNDRTLRIEFL